MLKFRVEGQKLTWENPDEVVVAGTKKYLECYFEFDGDAWSGFEYIEAFFKNGRDKPIRMLLSANRIWKEDGLCLAAGDWSVYLCATTYNAEKEEIERQITSSSVSIRVLAHGQFEDAQNSFESPEIANMYIAAMQVFEEAREEAENERAKAENARNVFEEYNSKKKYVKGNKVAYEGSSYVLTADKALGINPTDTESWLCIAEKGEQGIPGNDAVLPNGIMKYIRSVKELPVSASTGDVYRISETIYEKDTIAINGEYLGFLADDVIDGIQKVYFEIGSPLEKIAYASLSAGRMVYFSDGYLRSADIIDVGISEDYSYEGFGYFACENATSHFVSGLGGFENFRFTIPDEYISDELEKYRVVQYYKGECVVYDAVTWRKLGAEELSNVYFRMNYVEDRIDAKFRSYDDTLDMHEFYKADASLENVSNEDFKRKAEEAGVGGDDAGLADEKNYMVFKGVVDTLPETANEGEVYKVDGYMNEYVGWAFESYDDTFKIYPDRIEFGTETEIYTEVFNVIYKANGAMVNLELFNYDTGETHTIAATKAENNILYGATNVASGYVVGSGTMEFKQVGFVKKTCVRFNGEWVEL
jgi:hypothetical protein